MRKTDGQEKEIFERLTAAEQSLRSVNRRLDGMESIAVSVQEIAVEMKHMREDMNTIGSKVNDIEQRPAKRWDTVIAAVLGAVGGCMGAAIASLFIG